MEWNGTLGKRGAAPCFPSVPFCSRTCMQTYTLCRYRIPLSIKILSICLHVLLITHMYVHAWSCHIHTQHRVSPPPPPPTNHFSLSCHDHVVQVTLGGRAPSPDSGGPAMAVTRSWRWPDRAGSSPAPLRVSRVGMCGAIVCEGGAMVCEGGGMVCL